MRILFALSFFLFFSCDAFCNTAYEKMTEDVQKLYAGMNVQSNLRQEYSNYLEIISTYNAAVTKGEATYYVFPLDQFYFGRFLPIDFRTIFPERFHDFFSGTQLQDHSATNPEHYFDSSEQLPHELTFEDGLAFLDGQPFDTTDSVWTETHMEPQTKRSWQTREPIPAAIFVMAGNGKIYVHKFPIAGLEVHASLLAGIPAAAAGVVAAKQGKLQVVTFKGAELNVGDDSGHYAPPPRALDQVANEFVKQGWVPNPSELSIFHQGEYALKSFHVSRDSIETFRRAGLPYKMFSAPEFFYFEDELLDDVLEVNSTISSIDRSKRLLDGLQRHKGSKFFLRFVLRNYRPISEKRALNRTIEIFRFLQSHLQMDPDISGYIESSELEFDRSLDTLALSLMPNRETVREIFQRLKKISNARVVQWKLSNLVEYFDAGLSRRFLKKVDNIEVYQEMYDQLNQLSYAPIETFSADTAPAYRREIESFHKVITGLEERPRSIAGRNMSMIGQASLKLNDSLARTDASSSSIAHASHAQCARADFAE